MSDFIRQDSDPLFPKILWERPINKRAAKKLLIIGGHATQFSATQLAYQEALAAGIGEAKVVLPASVLKVTGNLPDCLFVPANASGSIARPALEEIESYIKDSDGVLLAGELSQNAETVSLLELIMRDASVPMVISDEVIQSLLYLPELLFTSPERLLIASTQTFMKLAGKLEVAVRIQAGINLLNKIALLTGLNVEHRANYVLSGRDTIVHTNSKTSVTSTPKINSFGDGVLATFYLQHQNTFEALTSAAFVLSQVSNVAEIKTVLSKLAD